MDQAA